MMKKILVVFFATIVFVMNGKAQGNRERLSLGVGCLYQNGLDLTLSYEHEGKYHRSLLTVISNGTSANLAVIPVRNHSGRITGVTGSVSPTSLAWFVGATITVMFVSGHRQEAIQSVP